MSTFIFFFCRINGFMIVVSQALWLSSMASKLFNLFIIYYYEILRIFAILES